MKNKKFYFDFEYFPEISYESYILKFFVDEKDLCELKNEKYKYDKLGDIYFIAYRLKSGKSLEKILTIPFPYDELKVKKEKKFTRRGPHKLFLGAPTQKAKLSLFVW